DEQVLLYGFPTASALGLFSTLTGVSGVGPRLALALLSSLSVNSLLQAIANGDLAALSAAPGVGRRTAGRIILELKGKLDAGEDGGSPVGASGDAEVVEALTALGYSNLEARRALDRVQDASGLSVEERIRSALQQFGTGG
ncbi:MAG: Holliday junction branch migration protein RuvA, partial [Chloroflexi bacterium]|nr:Holliday junction branch migration protein RuvA [Chloroflexota bacterium]